jgi:integrase
MVRRNKSGLPKYCCWAIDRHGKRRVRFRKGGLSTYLTGIPWGEDFMRLYAAALEGVAARSANIGASRTAAGTLAWLVAAYLDCSETSSSPFKTLAAQTQRTRRNILDNFRTAYGQLPLFRTEANGKRVMLLTRQHIQVMVNTKAATPFAQRNFFNTLRAAFQWAVHEGRLPDDPTLGVKRPKAKTDGYRPWSEAEIARFEAFYPVGARARLAFALLLFTGQRRADVVRMGPQHVHDDVLSIVQQKTGNPVDIPVHPKLREIIDATPSGHLSFLVTERGGPFDPDSFGNLFRKLSDAAGCHGLSAHGLRKAAGTRLADIGCSAHQIASVLGQTSLAMVAHYTKDAERKQLARSAMKMLIESGK